MSSLPAQDKLVCCFSSGNSLRSRSVSGAVLSAWVDIPAAPASLVADWERDIAQQLQLDAGDVEPLPLARARRRWPDYRQCVQAVADWTTSLGLQDLLAGADVALMACRGANYHHDATQYGGAAFCNLFLSEDQGQDIHFPVLDQHIALRRGTLVIFDTCQPHAVIRRGSSGFDALDFPPGRTSSQVFLSWELPIEDPQLASALGITFDIDCPELATTQAPQVFKNGAALSLCPLSGQWRDADGCLISAPQASQNTSA